MTSKPNEVMGGGELWQKWGWRDHANGGADELLDKYDEFLSDLRTHDDALIERLEGKIGSIVFTNGITGNQADVRCLRCGKSCPSPEYGCDFPDKKEKSNG